MNITKGNIFASNAEVIVNTVNCVGVMGAGLALECRLRYPDMFHEYYDLCKSGRIGIGELWVYDAGHRKILNFPTKKHWKRPSKIEYLEKGLEKFACSYEELGIKNIAFPLLGADRGGLPKNKSLEIMRKWLQGLPIHIEIYEYDPNAKDDLYDKFEKWVVGATEREISEQAGVGIQYARRVKELVAGGGIKQLNQLGKAEGVGIKTLQKMYQCAVSGEGRGGESEGEQLNLL